MKELGGAARARVASEFSVGAMVAGIEAVYEDLRR
jgi:hypothetical protein